MINEISVNVTNFDMILNKIDTKLIFELSNIENEKVKLMESMLKEEKQISLN
jgi:CTP:phosphocholine cytidylyltransferase-like protein